MTTIELQDGITAYLDYLEAGPESLLDQDLIAELEEKLASDDLPKSEVLVTRVALRNARNVDDSALIAGFISDAPKFMKENGQTRADFVEDCEAIGVPDAVLNEIPDEETTAPTGRVTRKGTADIIRTFKGEFTKKDAKRKTGASDNTLAKALKDCVDSGDIIELGGNPKLWKAA